MQLHIFLADCKSVVISLHKGLVYSGASVILIAFDKGTSKNGDFCPLSPGNMGIVFHVFCACIFALENT